MGNAQPGEALQREGQGIRPVGGADADRQGEGRGRSVHVFPAARAHGDASTCATSGEAGAASRSATNPSITSSCHSAWL